jgi:excisionase family DNA binding protein
VIAVDHRALVRALASTLRSDEELRREFVAALGDELTARSAPQYESVRARARRMAVGESTIRAQIADGGLSVVRVGRRVLVRVDAMARSPGGTTSDATAHAELVLGLRPNRGRP